jgi:phage terminase small subunit
MPQRLDNAKLTSQQIKFAEKLVELGSNKKAALAAGCKDDTAARNFYTYHLKNPHLLSHIKKLRDEIYQNISVDQTKLIERLEKIALGKDPINSIRAIAQLSKMLGYDATIKVDATSNGKDINPAVVILPSNGGDYNAK